ncbi:MAG: DUF1648 domain-containing protein [Patescibacteria group bacterium]|jgi:uncharacterized membrane protein
MNRKTFLVMCALIVACVAASLFFYPQFPERFASHWNAAGQADGWMSKSFGAFFVPGMMLFFIGLYALIPRIDPLKKNLGAFRKEYDLLWLALTIFFAYVHGITVLWNLGARFGFVRWMTPAFAGLWYVLGIVLSRAKRNWFVGIRTPWTLASDIVWDKTHEFGSKLFKTTALIALFGLLLPTELVVWCILIPALVTSLATIVYSFVVWKRLPLP